MHPAVPPVISPLGMLDLTGGELFVIGFVVVAVVSARWWPRLGVAIAERLSGAPRERTSAPPSNEPNDPR